MHCLHSIVAYEVNRGICGVCEYVCVRLCVCKTAWGASCLEEDYARSWRVTDSTLNHEKSSKGWDSVKPVCVCTRRKNPLMNDCFKKLTSHLNNTHKHKHTITLMWWIKAPDRAAFLCGVCMWVWKSLLLGVCVWGWILLENSKHTHTLMFIWLALIGQDQYSAKTKDQLEWKNSAVLFLAKHDMV